MNIVYCLDDNNTFIELAQMSINSILKFNPNAVIHIITKKYISALSEHKQYIFDVPNNIDWRRRNSNDVISNATYYKIYIQDILKDIDKCLFIDADVICQKPLDIFYNSDVQYYGGIPAQTDTPWQAKELNVPYYYNGGVLLMNLQNLRKIDIKKLILQKRLHSYSVKFWCHEETLLNSTVNHLFKKFDTVFNKFRRQWHGIEKDNDAYLLHFLGADKSLMKAYYNKHIKGMIDNYDNCPIVYCFDRGYLDLTTASINSIKKFNPTVKIILVTNEYFDELSEYEQHVINISKYKFPKPIGNTDTRLTDFTYVRLLLPEILKTYDKCLYLDGDILCKGSISELLNTDVVFFGGCLDIDEKIHLRESGIKNYVNAGVLLMNLKNLRYDNFLNKSLSFDCDSNSVFKTHWCHDQTIINELYRNKIKIIDRKYNTQLNYSHQVKISEIPNNSTLVHFLGTENKISFWELYFHTIKIFPKEVTCLMATYNTNLEFLDKTISCIINQKYSNIKFIICNDSPDNHILQNKLNEYALNDKRISVLKNDTNMGIGYTRQRLKNLSTSEFTAIIDDDDLYPDDKILRQVAVLMAKKDVSLCFTNCKTMGLKNNITLTMPSDDELKTSLMYENKILNASTMYRTKDFKNINYDVNLRFGEDYDFWFNAIIKNNLKFFAIREILYFYRKDSNSSLTKEFRCQRELHQQIIQNNFNFVGYNISDQIAKYLDPHQTPVPKLSYLEKNKLNSILTDICNKFNLNLKYFSEFLTKRGT